ncbi:hypothetical protein DCO58_11810 [Helicobacter saguini]|uniref:Uncharacterized protein n=1 Tax=Helicobacter saguini TaxID=1548018 RepID=A0A347VQ96_9HELI|nr:hypothetical protein [Helicobacter saguini]MWV61026.1 hypothetical protein [Helicobacter saguini]MWV68305.1 hypothetical protein [Helicobacter saguini]MWV70230.1 hypothetical protein [Helicobacter saguini]MWV72133.1 hypothetical protein [Helicobacter saguini]TLD91635.1 hypothetical protein LS64_011625 [Helicobacter saguini]
MKKALKCLSLKQNYKGNFLNDKKIEYIFLKKPTSKDLIQSIDFFIKYARKQRKKPICKKNKNFALGIKPLVPRKRPIKTTMIDSKLFCYI